MKSKIVILISIGLIMIFIIITSRINSFKEDTLYSQNDLQNYNSQIDNRNLVTRQKAIMIATDTFKEGLGIDLSNSDFGQTVNIYKSSNGYDWYMSWVNRRNNKYYTCIIDSETGDIRKIYINKMIEQSKLIEPIEFNEEKVKSIIKPLVTKLNIDLSQYAMILSDDRNNYLYLNFVNKNNRKEYFSISIDSQSKSIQGYEAKSNEEKLE